MIQPLNKSICGTLFFLLLFIALPVYASETSGTIQTGSQYGWGENIGWVNFAPQYAGTYQGLVVTDASVTGYAWSQTVGWINFSPTNSGQGVSNTPDGHLSGSAWVAGLGWLPMDTITIDSNGKFTGTAGSANSSVGRVNFDCDHCTVATDWRPISSRAHVHVVDNPNIGTSGGSPVHSQPVVSTLIPVTPPPSTITNNRSLPVKAANVQPEQPGSAQLTLPDGELVNFDSPVGIFEKGTTISISPEALDQNPPPSPELGAFLLHGVIFNIVAKDRDGKIVHNLKKTITIRIDIPPYLKSVTGLGAYYLDESNIQKKQWVSIPDATVVNGKMVIHVDHLTRFAIFGTRKQVATISTGDQKSHDIHYMYIVWVSIALILLYIALGRWVRKNRTDHFMK